MITPSSSQSSHRARWLAELTSALDKARRLASAMPDAASTSVLLAQIEGALAEVDRLRQIDQASRALPKPVKRSGRWQKEKD